MPRSCWVRLTAGWEGMSCWGARCIASDHRRWCRKVGKSSYAMKISSRFWHKQQAPLSDDEHCVRACDQCTRRERTRTGEGVRATGRRGRREPAGLPCLPNAGNAAAVRHLHVLRHQCPSSTTRGMLEGRHAKQEFTAPTRLHARYAPRVGKLQSHRYVCSLAVSCVFGRGRLPCVRA